MPDPLTQEQGSDLNAVFKDVMAKNILPKNIKVEVKVEEETRKLMRILTFLSEFSPIWS